MLTTKQLIQEANTLHLSGKSRYEFMGVAFGYPECCVQLFIDNAKPFWVEDLPWYPTRTLKLDGYIPCKKCANLPRQQLVDGINSRRKIEKIK